MWAIVLLQAVWIAPDDPNRCGYEELPLEPPRLAVVGEWGAPQDGLSIRILADSTRFDLGAGIHAGIGFRFDSSGMPSPPSLIDFTGDGAGFLLRFNPLEQTNAGPPIERFPHAFGGPWCVFQTCVALSDVHRHARKRVFYLLSNSAKQVPAGRYRVTAHYENDGGPLIGDGRHGRHNPEKCWAPPESVWIGTLDSAPIEVEIVERPPTARTIVVPTRFELVCRDRHHLQVREDSTSARTETVFVRLGYHFAWRSWDAIYVEDSAPVTSSWKDPEEVWKSRADPNARALSRRMSGRRSFREEDHILLEPIADLLTRGTQYRFRRKIIAFESSNAWGSHWNPELGDYRVLAQQILEAPWTMESLCR